MKFIQFHSSDYPPFEQAIIDGDTNKIKKYIDQGYDVNAISTIDRNMLTLSFMYGSPKKSMLKEATGGLSLNEREPKIIEILQLLINNGANINAIDKMGMAPIHYAIEYHYYEVVKMLINNGANVNLRDESSNSEKTPLEWALQGNMDIDRKIVELLSQHGAK